MNFSVSRSIIYELFGFPYAIRTPSVRYPYAIRTPSVQYFWFRFFGSWKRIFWFRCFFWFRFFWFRCFLVPMFFGFRCLFWFRCFCFLPMKCTCPLYISAKTYILYIHIKIILIVIYLNYMCTYFFNILKYITINIYIYIYTCHIRKAVVFATECGILIARVCMIFSHCVFIY